MKFGWNLNNPVDVRVLINHHLFLAAFQHPR